MSDADPRLAVLRDEPEIADGLINPERLLAELDAADRAAGIVRVDTNDEALVERLGRTVLANDGGTCHDFGRQHCFNDPTARYRNERCSACRSWAERMAEAVLAALKEVADE